MITSQDKPRNELFFLEVKYERAPRFCAYCGCIGHGQRDCKLPVDLQEMRYTAKMRASPYKKSNSRGGYVAPVASSARRLLSFGKEVTRNGGSPIRSEYERVPEEVLENPVVQAAIAAVSKLQVLDGGSCTNTQVSSVAPTAILITGNGEGTGIHAKLDPSPPEDLQQNMADATVQTPPCTMKPTEQVQIAKDA